MKGGSGYTGAIGVVVGVEKTDVVGADQYADTFIGYAVLI